MSNSHANRIPPQVVPCYPAQDGGISDEDDMDFEDRLRAVEMASQRNNDKIDSHERECSLRYKQIVDGQARIGGHMKHLTLAVCVLALVSLGIATVNDLIRSGAARIGVTVQAAPVTPQPR